ncbi:MAG: hypothetical protein PHU99_05420 [Candidatus Cloacimonetes bacterium]|jgi:hypothetical protein|nr:hypothetical protein [Candidatus Cloacimonadota bacterium]MDY0337303.1 hypothetical protein [Candidatus Cloacimonadaceae bacterium]MCB5269318.1 hypothetical protein [Candidatus Cloacimonadota bacterium]MCK9333983.1 hypothetical protein [Candidatus Cloacimonadota bacterium]MDD2682709.1 hypothetical protein [Candidatus Cloacimonadota bacterium]
MKTFKICLVLLAVILLLSACTRKDNLTGDNWSEISAQSFDDINAVVDGFSFPPDTLVSISANRRCLPIGNWQGAHARGIVRFTGLPAQSSLAEYHSLQDPYLKFTILRRDQADSRQELNLKLHKVLRSFIDPDSLSAEDYEYFADLVVPATISSNDTITVELETSFIQNWQSDADSTGLNILILPEEGVEGFVEIRLSSTTEGSKLGYSCQVAAEDEQVDFATYATKEAYSFNHPGAEVDASVWKLSNFNPQRMFVDLQPDSTLFVDPDNNILSPEDLKRVSINKAELVLFIDKSNSNLLNAFSYYVSAFLVKEKPENPEVIATTNMESIIFSYPLTSYATNSADSLVINITPIIQSYTAGKKDPQGIVIMSNYERKDFGEIQFYTPQSSDLSKMPYIRVRYTPPFL